MYNTRLNPSVDGNLHLGHVYMALINESMAHESGGDFVVRFDDTHPIRLEKFGKDRTELMRQGQQDDLTWLGIEPNIWIRQSDVIGEVHEYLASKFPVFKDDHACIAPVLLGDDFTPIYPYTPTLTAEKVVMDYFEGVNLLVRGIDLMSEYGLYQYYCEALGLPQPKHIYLPRLKWSHGDMSKTFGSQTISDLRYSGYTPEQVRGLVETSCLRHPSNGWVLHNLKGLPRL